MPSFFSKLHRWFGIAKEKLSPRSRRMLQLETLESRVVPIASVNMIKTLSLEEGGLRMIAVTRGGTPAELNQSLSVLVRFTDGTAKYNTDYNRPAGQSQTITFAPGVKIINLPAFRALKDDTDEPNQYFTVNLSLPPFQVANFVNKTCTVTILDTDATPSYQFDTFYSINVTEGDVYRTFDVKLSRKSDYNVKVTYLAQIFYTSKVTYGKDFAFTTSDGAIAYPTATNVLFFSPGETRKTITLQVREDSIYEGPQPFQIYLSYAYQATQGFYRGAKVLITDDDNAQVSISDAPAVNEGGSSSEVYAEFDVTILKAEAPVVFFAQTIASTATPTSDYHSTGGLVEIAPGDTSAFLDVLLRGDNVKETPSTENFFVQLTSGHGTPITFGRSKARATIFDDDTTTNPATPVPISATYFPSAFPVPKVVYKFQPVAGTEFHTIEVRKVSTGQIVTNVVNGFRSEVDDYSSFYQLGQAYVWRVRTGYHAIPLGPWSVEKTFTL